MTDTSSGARPHEYVADRELIQALGSPDILDIDSAASAWLDYLRIRIAAIAHSEGRPLDVMLSGGIDSQIVAAVASELGVIGQAVTFVAPMSDSPGRRVADDEVYAAQHCAEILGIECVTVSPDIDSFGSLVDRTVAMLHIDEPWEVAAGIPLLACTEALNTVNSPAVLTGAGADALVLGGERLKNHPASVEGLNEFRSRTAAMMNRNFREKRLIPDFYRRLIGESANHHYQVFQTFAAVDLWKRMSPEALYSDHIPGMDKACFRLAGEKLGLPKILTRRPKNPLQVSSGVVPAIADLARQRLAGIETHTVYADPESEPTVFTAARLELERRLIVG